MSKYIVSVLEKYNQTLRCSDLQIRIDGINHVLTNADYLIDIDKTMLEKVFSIKLPRQTDIDDVVSQVLSILILEQSASSEAIPSLDILSYQSELAPYFQFYYTIVELGLEDLYKVWITKFRNSGVYKLYVTNVMQNDRALRWRQSMEASRESIW
jgi:hypothetical protein